MQRGLLFPESNLMKRNMGGTLDQNTAPLRSFGFFPLSYNSFILFIFWLDVAGVRTRTILTTIGKHYYYRRI
jgi:hypothetical protein